MAIFPICFLKPFSTPQEKKNGETTSHYYNNDIRPEKKKPEFR
jgi:hypothetical protein